MAGFLDSASGTPFTSGTLTAQSTSLPLYGLSQVFVAPSPRAVAVEFASEPASGDTYGRGETVLIDLVFNRLVTVRGMPTLDLEMGARDVRMRYRSGSGTARLRFAYAVQLGDTSDSSAFSGFVLEDLSVVSPQSTRVPVHLDGATIAGAGSGAAVDLTVTEQIYNAHVRDQRGHKVDGRRARATGVSIPSAPADGTAYAAGETVTVALAMSEPVLVTGTPHVRLNVGGAARRAAYAGPRGAATSGLRFEYVVQAGDFDADGVQICSQGGGGCGRISLDGGSLRASSDGTDADLRHPKQGAQGDDRVDARPTIAPPAATGGGACPRERRVPDDWPLKPSGVDAGESFRLLFVTSTSREATSSDIADYNSFVQSRAANGHSSIRFYSSGFRAVGSTGAVDARDNTCSRSSDTDAPIYWLNGAGVADDYGDFYDGSWDDERNPKDERGRATSPRRVFTGSEDDGTEAETAGRSAALGADNNAGAGRADTSRSGDLDATRGNPLAGEFNSIQTNPRPLYGLSPVFRVPSAGEGARATGRAILSSPAIGDTYRRGEAIEFEIAFSEAVAVQGAPWLELAIGGGRGRAEYDRGSGTDELVFRYVVQAGDRDSDGFQPVGREPIKLDGATIRAVADDADARLVFGGWFPEDAGHKVDGSLSPDRGRVRTHAAGAGLDNRSAGPPAQPRRRAEAQGLLRNDRGDRQERAE